MHWRYCSLALTHWYIMHVYIQWSVSSLVAPKCVMTTTSGATSDDEVNLMTTLFIQCIRVCVLRTISDATFDDKAVIITTLFLQCMYECICLYLLMWLTTTSCATNDDKVGILTTLSFQCMNTYINVCISWWDWRQPPVPPMMTKLTSWQLTVFSVYIYMCIYIYIYTHAYMCISLDAPDLRPTIHYHVGGGDPPHALFRSALPGHTQLIDITGHPE